MKHFIVKNEKQILYGLVLVLTLVLGAVQWKIYSSRPVFFREPLVIGTTIADLGNRVFQTHLGESTTLTSLARENLILVFLHTECTYCILDIPLWKQLSQKSEVIGITREDDFVRVQEFSRLHGLNFPILLDPEGELFERLGVEDTPTKFALTSELRIIQKWEGRTSRQSLQAELGSLLTMYDIEPDDLPDVGESQFNQLPLEG